MNGVKVSSKPIASPTNAATLTLAMATVLSRHWRFRTYHDTSQTMIATVVTPESVPTGA